MLFALIAMHVLEVMFFIGLAGSAVVVVISFIEDGKAIFDKEELREMPAKPPAAVDSALSRH